MTRFFIHYYTHDNGWIEFETKEARDNALQGLEEGDYELDNLCLLYTSDAADE